MHLLTTIMQKFLPSVILVMTITTTMRRKTGQGQGQGQGQDRTGQDKTVIICRKYYQIFWVSDEYDRRGGGGDDGGGGQGKWFQ
ncbi:unnamed protein product [Brugia pahangi]|uniref:Secreted protein n=1 Tax=Brugia pahangi TaxID=6280 RepID=A0A0N4TUE6_BRUPA|nr:unnamed protein product [Brugia pahangi]